MIEMMGVDGEVVAVDIDIRDHNKKLIKKHPMYKRVTMYEGSSVDPKIIDKIKKHVKNKKCVMVILDSNHSHNHVLEELKMYTPFITVGSYCIKRPWDVGNNPYTAMKAFLKKNKNFSIDKSWSNKGVITETIDGYLKKIS